jgi:hypothetical protein
MASIGTQDEHFDQGAIGRSLCLGIFRVYARHGDEVFLPELRRGVQTRPCRSSTNARRATDLP